jgi:hypothetical protein
MIHRALAAAGTVLLAAAATATSADAGVPPAKSSFTVMTSFVSSPSEIVAATGPWADCTDVTDLSNYANQVSPTKVQFSGEKLVGCASGDVVIHYDATMNFRSEQGLTFGSWSVVSSENPSIQGGSGTVSGDPRGCPDCILDVFTGRVY